MPKSRRSIVVEACALACLPSVADPGRRAPPGVSSHPTPGRRRIELPRRGASTRAETGRGERDGKQCENRDLETLLGLNPGASERPVVELSEQDALWCELGLWKLHRRGTTDRPSSSIEER